jgi:hypothetical protein
MTASTVSDLRPDVHCGLNRIAFYGKCGSAKDAPLSLLRQPQAVASALSGNTPTAACFADIGVWNRSRDGAPRVLSLAGLQVRGELSRGWALGLLGWTADGAGWLSGTDDAWGRA